jgi:hypothetical protein
MSDRFRSEVQRRIDDASESELDDDVRWIVRIGPVEADVLLSFSRGNRNESTETVQAYARDMAQGNWVEENGSPFLFTRSGRLGNGHHRLYAIKRSGAVIRVVLSFGNPEESVNTTDAGRPRSISDRLQLAGRTSTTRRVASLRMAMTLASGHGHASKRTLAEIEQAEKDHSMALKGLAPHIGPRFPAAFWGAMIFAHPVSPASVEALAEEVCRGEGVSGPAFTLREYITRTKSAGFTHQMNIAKRTLYAARAHLERRPLTKFAPKDDDSIVDWFRARRK